MAINNIPGVGPTNADIATAVAAPSAAAIVTAGNAAGWNATAPTTTDIVNAGNAANWNAAGITWTNLGTVNFSNTSSGTVSGLSGYKYIKLQFTLGLNSAATQFAMRFNGDSSDSYYYWNIGQFGTSMAGQTANAVAGWWLMTPGAVQAGQPFAATVNIENNTGSTFKFGSLNGVAYNTGGAVGDARSAVTYASTTVISSLAILNTAGSNFNGSSYMLVLGGN